MDWNVIIPALVGLASGLVAPVLVFWRVVYVTEFNSERERHNSGVDCPPYL